LRTAHRRLIRSKPGGQSKAGSIAVAAADRFPFPLMAWSVRLLTRLPQRGVVTVATNVPGPRRQIKVMGRTVLSLLPLPPIAVHLRLGIAITSYADELAFGVLGDFDASVAADEIASSGIQRLVTVTPACKKSRRMWNQLLRLTS
jgi:diacylglycerol O-acyltransferase